MDYQSYETPMSALQKLLAGSPESNADNPQGYVRSRLRQEDLLKEMKRNRELAVASARPERAGTGSGIGWQAPTPAYHGGVTGAAEADIADLTDQLNESPNFGVEAVGQQGNFLKALAAANTQGFGSPQEAAAYGRKQEAERLNMPLTVANATGGYGIREAEIKAKSAQELQQNDPMHGYYDLLKSRLGMPDDPANPGIKSISKSGATFESPKPPTAAMFGDVRKAQLDLDNATHWYGNAPDWAQKKAALDRERQLAGITPGADVPDVGVDPAEIEDYAHQLLEDVTIKNLSWDQIQKAGILVQPATADNPVPVQMSPAQLTALKDTLMRLRGF